MTTDSSLTASTSQSHEPRKGTQQIQNSWTKLGIFDWGLNTPTRIQKVEVSLTRTMTSQSPPNAVTWEDNTLVSKIVQLKMNGSDLTLEEVLALEAT